MNEEIYNLINSSIRNNRKIFIAIEGPCASGKTTLSEKIAESFDCNIIHIDDFFLPFDKRTPERMAEVGGNFDYDRFADEVIANLQSGKPFTYGKFDCSKGKVTDKIEITPKTVTVIEGVYSMHPHFDDIYDFRIFIEINEEMQLNRLKKRSHDKLDRFINEWIPRENAYFEKYDIKNKCDIVIESL